jgi:prepilin-type N-terminal cleavage/methylation domain-containing protein
MKFLRTIGQIEKGFTLLEILIAMIILAAAGSMIMLAYSQAILSTRLVDEQNMATNLARERIEFLKQYENASPPRQWGDTVWTTDTLQSSYRIQSAGLSDPTVNQIKVQVTVSKNGRTIVQMIAYYKP